MTVIVKMMSDEDAPDSDTRKLYILFTDVYGVKFTRDIDGNPSMELTFETGYKTDSKDDALYTEVFEVTGNVYVMNEAGKTIASFGSTPLPPNMIANTPISHRGGVLHDASKGQVGPKSGSPVIETLEASSGAKRKRIYRAA